MSNHAAFIFKAIYAEIDDAGLSISGRAWLALESDFRLIIRNDGDLINKFIRLMSDTRVLKSELHGHHISALHFVIFRSAVDRLKQQILNPSIPEDRIWRWCIDKDPQRPLTLKARKKCIYTIMANLIKRVYGGRLIRAPGLGNCLPLCISIALYGTDLAPRYMQRVREVLVGYVEDNFNNYLFDLGNQAELAQDGKYLGEEHINGFHLMHRTNVVKFEYDPDRNDFAKHFWFEERWRNKPIVALLRTQFGGEINGHYDYIEGIEITYVPDKTVEVPPPGKKHPDLKAFDNEHGWKWK